MIIFVSLGFWSFSNSANGNCWHALENLSRDYNYNRLVPALPDSYLNQEYLIGNFSREGIPVKVESPAFSTELFPEIFRSTRPVNAVIVSYSPKVLIKGSELPKSSKRIFVAVAQDDLEFFNYSQKIVVGNNLVDYFQESMVLGPELKTASEIVQNLKNQVTNQDEIKLSEMDISFLKSYPKKIQKEKMEELEFLTRVSKEINRVFPKLSISNSKFNRPLGSYPQHSLMYWIEIGYGYCQQKSVLAQLVFEKLNLSSQILTSSPLDESGRVIGLHAANLVRLGKGDYYFDTSLNVIFPFTEKAFAKRLKLDLGDRTKLNRINLTNNLRGSDLLRTKDWYKERTSFTSRMEDLNGREKHYLPGGVFLTEEQLNLVRTKIAVSTAL